MRVEDVLAALVGPGGGDGPVVRVDDGGDLPAEERVLDADPRLRLG
jgi:hypothetical protein